MSNWLVRQVFRMHSGRTSHFKIECDELTNDEIDAFAMLIAEMMHPFGKVYGIPRGGMRIREALLPYLQPMSERVLIVDDVLTTGRSMNEKRFELIGEGHRIDLIIGAVMFSRGPQPMWVDSVFNLHPRLT